MEVVRAKPVLVIRGLALVGGILRLLAWSELEEHNWFDIVMREGPPFEDLSETGRLYGFASWVIARSPSSCW